MEELWIFRIGYPLDRTAVGVIRFFDVAIDPAGRELRRGSEVVNVEPQVFDVLLYLVEHRARVVSKIELYDAVWKHRFVSESALTSRIKTARQIIGDTGRDQRMIRTVHGTGYRFIAPVGEQPAEEQPPSGGERSHDPLAELSSRRGASVQVDSRSAAGTAWLRGLRERARREGIPVGQGSARRAALRSYSCIIDALDEVLLHHPRALDDIAPACRDEIEGVLRGGVPTQRQRWTIAVRELVAASARETGLVVVLEHVEHADADTVALIAHLGELTRHHPLLLAVGAGQRVDGLSAFVPIETPTDAAIEFAEDAAVALPDDVRAALDLVSLIDPPFGLDTLSAALGEPPATCLRLLDFCEAAGALEHHKERYRIDFDRVAIASASEHRRREGHRTLAARLAAAGDDPERIAHHLIHSGQPRAAIRHVIKVATQRIEAGLFREVLGWIEPVLSEASGAELSVLHSLRGAALAGMGDPAAVSSYRQALRFAQPEHIASLRSRLAMAALRAGDVTAAQEALAGLEPDGGPADGEIYLARGNLFYLLGDVDAAEAAAAAARHLALAPGAPARLLDVITLQGLIDHNRGKWSDRLFRELRNHQTVPDMATTVFDSHLCVAEYLLYGPTPYREVVALADRLREQAESLDAQRGVAFAVCVAGEAELLAGNLDQASALLARSVELHRELNADTGLAHSLQRLAEVALHGGDRKEAERLAREALLLAHWSPLSWHLLQRIFGTLIAASIDSTAALAVVDEATQVLDTTNACVFCQVMFSLPAAIACAEGGRLEEAEVHLAVGELSASMWQGTAWQGAVSEAKASVARARGDEAAADRLLEEAARAFERADQPIDAERCREARRSTT